MNQPLNEVDGPGPTLLLREGEGLCRRGKDEGLVLHATSSVPGDGCGLDRALATTCWKVMDDTCSILSRVLLTLASSKRKPESAEDYWKLALVAVLKDGGRCAR